MSMGRATCPVLWAAALGAAQPWKYLSPQGVLLQLVYGTTASPLWLELRGHSAWQATPSWTVYRLVCHRLLPWLRVMFAMVPDAAWPGSDQWPWSTAPATGPVGRLGRPSAFDPWGVGSFLSLGRPTCVQCPGLLGSCSPVCPRGLLCCVCGVLGHLAPVHRCARSVCCFACAVSWATWLLFTGVPAQCVVLRVRRPGPPGSCSPVCPLRVLCCACGVLGHLAPVHRCGGSVCCFACAVSRAWLGGGGGACVGLRVCLLLSPRSLPLPFPSSLFACLLFILLFWGGGWVGAFLVLCVGVGVCPCRCWCGRGCRGGLGLGSCCALGSLCVCRPPGFRFPGRRSGGCSRRVVGSCGGVALAWVVAAPG